MNQELRAELPAHGQGQLEPHPIEDPAHLDARRAAAGQGPFAGYEVQIRICRRRTGRTVRLNVRGSGAAAPRSSLPRRAAPPSQNEVFIDIKSAQIAAFI